MVFCDEDEQVQKINQAFDRLLLVDGICTSTMEFIALKYAIPGSVLGVNYAK